MSTRLVVKGLFYYFQNKWFIKTVIAAAPYLIAVILSLTPLQKYFVTDNRVNLWGIVLIILGGALTVLQVLSNKFSSDIYDDGKSFQAENQVRSKIMVQGDDRKTKALLIDRKQAIKEPTVILPIVGNLSPKDYPISLKKIRKELSEKIKEL